MEELAQLSNASAGYDEIASNGPPSQPLQFPDPAMGKAARVTALVYNPQTQDYIKCDNVIYRLHGGIAGSGDGTGGGIVPIPGITDCVRDMAPMITPGQPDRAYWIGRKLKKAIYGCVRACTVLRARTPTEAGAGVDNGGGTQQTQQQQQQTQACCWEITSTMAAVKIVDWNAVRAMRGRHTEDPIKEVACMQYVASHETHPNVLGTWDVLADDQYMFSFMPFCTGGEMFSYVERDGRFPEPLARYWFRQILQGLFHLQKKGVCHRDISLENLLVDKNTKCLVIDMGMCLRVPFAPNSDDDNGGTGTEASAAVDVTAGTLRRLMIPQGQCGKPNYISPEVLLNTDPFDGFAVDLWATGIILFVMLVGLPPFEFASDQDPRFRMITRGGLMAMLNQWNRSISDEAGELLQNMLRRDPRERLPLIEVMDHPWVLDENTTPPQVPDDQEWRS